MNYKQLKNMEENDPEKVNDLLLMLKLNLDPRYFEYKKNFILDCILKNMKIGGVKKNADGSYERTELWVNCNIEEIKAIMDGSSGKTFTEIKELFPNL